MTNCPNCGAPKQGSSCPYCGTEHETVSKLAIGKVATVSFEHQGQVYEFKFIVGSLDMKMSANPTHYRDFGGKVVRTAYSPSGEVSIGGDLMPEDGRLYTVREKEGKL